MNLYTISQSMQLFLASIPDDMTDKQASEMQARFLEMSDTFEEKITDAVKYMKQQEEFAKGAANEIARLSDLKKSYERKSEQMQNYIDIAMQTTGTQSLSLSIAKISYRKSSSVIVDEQKVSDTYKKTKEVTTVDKIAIKKAIDAGEVVEGAYIQEKNNIQIK